MAELLLEIGNVDPSIQSPTTEAVPQQMWRDPFSLPHFTRPCLLKPRILSSFIQQPLDLPGGDMALIPALEDIPTCPPLQMVAQGL